MVISSAVIKSVPSLLFYLIMEELANYMILAALFNNKFIPFRYKSLSVAQSMRLHRLQKDISSASLLFCLLIFFNITSPPQRLQQQRCSSAFVFHIFSIRKSFSESSKSFSVTSCFLPYILSLSYISI